MLVIITNRKSHKGFQLVSKSVTLNGLEQHNVCYFVSLYRIRKSG